MLWSIRPPPADALLYVNEMSTLVALASKEKITVVMRIKRKIIVARNSAATAWNGCWVGARDGRDEKGRQRGRQ